MWIETLVCVPTVAVAYVAGRLKGIRLGKALMLAEKSKVINTAYQLGKAQALKELNEANRETKGKTSRQDG